MSRVQKLRVFVSQRLNAAVEEILGVFEKTLIKYEEEAALCQEVISRQHALLCAVHKPLMDLPPADAFTQQLSVNNKEVPPEHQDQDQEDPVPPHVRQERGEEQLQDLDEADIIQFTYNARCAVKPGEQVDWLSAAGTVHTEPGTAGPDQDVQIVSSETEDSDDYDKDLTNTRSASNQLKPKRGCSPGGRFSCRVCSQTFKAQRFLLRHITAHLREAEPICGLCGERFEAAESLKLHIQTHLTTPMRKLENRTRTRSGEGRFHQHLQADTNARVYTSKKQHTCDDCGTASVQVWKKRRHRCRAWTKDPHSPEGTAKRTKM
ncbi:uncharacterized protein LOC143335015 [Chaetodon auriga]|uniref:uncharacterized protein LOC143335015 n=1 Tax=Chaetodon auriga TaxID=39042 RepID=UPI004032B62F